MGISWVILRSLGMGLARCRGECRKGLQLGIVNAVVYLKFSVELINMLGGYL